MLYVTTTQKVDTYTASRAIRDDRSKDGGLFVPFQLPFYGEEDLVRFQSLSFGQRMAQILNLFFSCRLTGWDMDASVGKCPVKAVTMSHRIIVAELWHNPEKSYVRMEQALAERICSDLGEAKCSSWVRIAIRIGILFHTFAELVKAGEVSWDSPVDISVTTGDFSGVMSCWYARAMGLPVANIVCACNENSSVWDLLHHGQFRTDTAAVETTTPLGDFGIPGELERLIFGTLGLEESLRYREICMRGGMYVPPAERFEILRKGMFAAVISRARIEVLISSVYRTNAYLMGPYTALAYGGLTDYRAKTGENRTVLLLADRDPVLDASVTAQALGVEQSRLQDML